MTHDVSPDSKKSRFKLSNLFTTPKSKHDDGAHKPTTIPVNHGRTDLVQSFDAMALSSSHPSQHASRPPGFVGGFHVTDNNARPSFMPAQSTPGPGPLPQPPVMPMPQSLPPSHKPSNSFHTSPHRQNTGPGYPYPVQQQSLTMQHALRPDPFAEPLNLLTPPSTHTRPHSSSHLPIHTNHSPNGQPQPKPSSPLGHHANKHKRAASTPPPASPVVVASPNDKKKKSPASGKGDAVQCSGVTKAGKRCTRQVKLDTPLDDDDDDNNERFCYQHTKELLGPTGYYARKTGVWVKFEDWIPDYLQPSTQVALRVEMERARSSSDVPGYIYTFEIRDPSSPDIAHLKVGRAVNLVKRIDQWGKQCGSKEQVLRGWFPGSVDPSSDDDGDGDPNSMSLMKGRVRPGPKGAWCHRLERLIHLELGDIIETNIHLEPGWPAVTLPATAATKAKSPKKASGTTARQCPDCGQMHKEIFSFARITKGRLKGKEWEGVVKPIIEKWGAFVEAYV